MLELLATSLALRASIINDRVEYSKPKASVGRMPPHDVVNNVGVDSRAEVSRLQTPIEIDKSLAPRKVSGSVVPPIQFFRQNFVLGGFVQFGFALHTLLGDLLMEPLQLSGQFLLGFQQ